MSSPAQPTLASTHVRDFHTLPEEQVAPWRALWEAPVASLAMRHLSPDRQPVALSEAQFQVLLNGDVCDAHTYASYENYERLTAALMHPTSRLTHQQALLAWRVLSSTKRVASPRSLTSTALLKSARAMGDLPFGEEQAREECKRYLTLFCKQYTQDAIISQTPLAGLLSLLIGPLKTVEVWCESLPDPTAPGNICDYLTPPAPEERDALHTLLSQQLDALEAADRPFSSHYSSAAIYLADEARLRRLREERYLTYCSRRLHPLRCAKLFDDRDDFVGQPDTWKFELEEWQQMVARAVAIEAYEQLAQRVPQIEELPRASDKLKTIKLFHDVHSRHLTPMMLHFYAQKSIGKEAARWLIDEGANAIVGLCEAATHTGKKGAVPVELLRSYMTRGHGELIEALLTQWCSEKAQRAVHKQVLDHYLSEKEVVEESERPDWFDALQKEKAIKSKKIPNIITLEALPALQTRGGALLSEEGRELFLKVLKESTLEAPHHAVAKFRDWLDPTSATQFVNAAFEAWVRGGANATHKWLLFALGLFGDQSSVVMLTPHMKKWPKQRAGQRAVWGLDVLEQIGGEVAIGLMLDLSKRNNEDLLQRTSEAALVRLATRQHVTLEELEDLVVPPCGFNERGERDFDYGPRQFVLRLDATLKPIFFDVENQKYLKSLPREKKGDDAESVERARASYELDKKLLQRTIKDELYRFEQAVTTRKGWRAAHWQRHLLHHPLLTNFARRLLWSAPLEGREGTHVFRVTEDLTLANIDDEQVTLAPGAIVTLMHPAQLAPAQLDAWANILSDYEILQPFDQLLVEANRLDEVARGQVMLAPSTPATPLTAAALYPLSYEGWRFDGTFSYYPYSEADEGIITSTRAARLFPGVKVAAMMTFSPGFQYIYDEQTPQQITGVSFVDVSALLDADSVRPVTPTWEQLEAAPRLKLGEVDAGVVSHIVSSLEEL